MYIYGINLAVIGLLYFFIYHSRTPKIAFLKLSLLYLFIISSFRHQTIGTDYIVYVQIFRYVIQGEGSWVERGYTLLNRLVGMVTHHYVGLAVAVNTFLFVPLYFYIRNNVHPRYWGLCVFIFAANPYMFVQSTFNVLRQTCATGILLIGMNALLNRNRKKLHVLFYFFMVLIAAQFHKISYTFVLVPLLLSIKWQKAYWYVLTVVAIALNFVGVRALAAIAVRVFGFGSDYISYESSMLNNPIYVMFVTVVIFFLLSHYEAYAAEGKETKRIIDLYLFSLCFLIMALPNDSFYRVYMMLAFCALPGVPAVCASTRPGSSRIRIKHEEYYVEKLYVFYYLFFYVGYVALLAIKQNTAYVPFRFFFN